MILNKVEKFLENNRLLITDKTYLVGFSGGFDSMCLLDILEKYSKKIGFNLIALHLNHNWRKNEAKNEEQNCENFCKEKNIEFICETLDDNVKKTETAARKARQKFFKKYYEKYNADGLFLAHTKSDNTETILYRIIKGTGINGLCGISAHNEIDDMEIYRPLIDCTRKEIEDYCVKNTLCPNNDSSNNDIKYSRNFIRHKIIPEIKNLNTEFDEAVAKLSSIADSEQNIVNEYLEKIKSEIYKENRFLTQNFISQSVHVQKRFILNFLIENNLDYDSKKVDEIFDFIQKYSSSKSGKTLSLTTDTWLFVNAVNFYSFEKAEKCTDEITVNGEGIYELNGYFLHVKPCSACNTHEFPKETEHHACVCALPFPMTLRYRKDGDIIQPFGMTGTMKLKKFFINKNVPKNVRDSVILLCKKNEVLWACGYALSEKLRSEKQPEYIMELKVH